MNRNRKTAAPKIARGAAFARVGVGRKTGFADKRRVGRTAARVALRKSLAKGD